MRYACLCLVLVAGCASKPPAEETKKPPKPEPEQAFKNLKEQADIIGQAAVNEDIAKTMELTHPALIEKLGGPKVLKQKMDSMAAEMKAQGFRIKKCTLEEPSEIVESEGELFAVVPTNQVLSGPGGKEGKQDSYLIAVSKDGGTTWKFIDGYGLAGSRSQIKLLFPNFPEHLKLPQRTLPVWDR